MWNCFRIRFVVLNLPDTAVDGTGPPGLTIGAQTKRCDDNMQRNEKGQNESSPFLSFDHREDDRIKWEL
jgi:hypothetical protein